MGRRQTAPLDPDIRSTLRDLLTPPDGYELEKALGTAYSLDAETLVAIPLFAAGLDAEQMTRPVGIARVYDIGSRLTLLVQGDRINVASRWAGSRPLLRLVGDAVVPCSIETGSFHPKLLVLCFTAVENPHDRLHRVVVATRNLTTDNSWDSVVVLDEASGGVEVEGLADTIAELADFVNDQSHPAVTRFRQMGKALRAVRFQPLPGINDLALRLFHPRSHNADDVFATLRGEHLLVVSPFVRQGLLDRLARQAGTDRTNRWLVTRPVDVPPSAFTNFGVFQIQDGAVPEHPLRGSEDDEPDRLSGLHAKLYVASTPKADSRIVVTSANASSAGWSGNVEVAVTGTSRLSALEVPQLVAGRSNRGDDRTFGDLLVPITPAAVTKDAPDPDWVTDVRKVLAGAIAVGTLSAGPPRTLELSVALGSASKWPTGVAVNVHPFGYPQYRGPLALSGSGMSAVVAVEPGMELTPFIVLTLRKGDEPPLDIVLAMPLGGDVDWDRDCARKVLAEAAKPWLLQELRWYFGLRDRGSLVRRSGSRSSGSAVEKPLPVLPVLERLLLRVHGPNARREIEMIDSLLDGVDDNDYPGLRALWESVRGSVP